MNRKDSIDVAIAESGSRGEVRHWGVIGGERAALDKALRKLVALGHPVHFVYEAGPCGYWIYRHLSAKGLACEVVPLRARREARRADQDRPPRRDQARSPARAESLPRCTCPMSTTRPCAI
jgi:transposase